MSAYRGYMVWQSYIDRLRERKTKFKLISLQN